MKNVGEKKVLRVGLWSAGAETSYPLYFSNQWSDQRLTKKNNMDRVQKINSSRRSKEKGRKTRARDASFSAMRKA